MNFKDIEIQEIKNFLKLNNQPITDDLYNDAIELINADYTIMTNTINYWLIAFEHKNVKHDTISYYNKLFNTTDLETIQILKYLHRYIEFSNIPEDIIKYIMTKLDNQLQYVNKKFNKLHQENKKCKHFLYERTKNLLICNNYNPNINYHIMDTIIDVLNPKSGKLIHVCGEHMQNISHPENFTKILNINNIYGLLTTSGKVLFMNKTCLSISPISDIVFNNGYYILSEGKVIKSDILSAVNIYNYNSRGFINQKFDYMENLNNIISMVNYNGQMYFLKTNGELYDDELNLIEENVKQCCADEHLYILKYDNQLMIDMITTEYKFKKLITGRKVLLISNDSQGYIYNKTLILYNVKNIISGSIDNNNAFLINDKTQLFKVTDGIDVNTNINVINVTLVHNTPLEYFIIY